MPDEANEISICCSLTASYEHLINSQPDLNYLNFCRGLLAIKVGNEEDELLIRDVVASLQKDPSLSVSLQNILFPYEASPKSGKITENNIFFWIKKSPLAVHNLKLLIEAFLAAVGITIKFTEKPSVVDAKKLEGAKLSNVCFFLENIGECELASQLQPDMEETSRAQQDNKLLHPNDLISHDFALLYSRVGSTKIEDFDNEWRNCSIEYLHYAGSTFYPLPYMTRLLLSVAAGYLYIPNITEDADGDRPLIFGVYLLVYLFCTQPALCIRLESSDARSQPLTPLHPIIISCAAYERVLQVAKEHSQVRSVLRSLLTRYPGAIVASPIPPMRTVAARQAQPVPLSNELRALVKAHADDYPLFSEEPVLNSSKANGSSELEALRKDYQNSIKGWL